MKTKPTLECVTCQDSEQCAFGYSALMALPCTEDVPLGADESCYTRIFDGNITFISEYLPFY